MKRLAILGLLLLAPTIVGPIAAQDTACPGFESHLEIGDMGQVTPGSANNVRTQPAAASDLVGKLEPGERFTVLAGPVCAEDYTWWQVQSLTNSTLAGYTVEGVPDDYWLEPIDLAPATLTISPDAVSLDFTPIANNVLIELRTPEDGSNYFWDESPEHIHISFPDLYYSEDITPFIFLYPVDFFATYDPDSYASILAYHATLYDDTPDELGDAWVTFQPSFHAALIHRSHGQYIQGQGFRGYRFLAQFSQYPAPVRGGELFYTFQGITDDGATYISAALPVWCPLQDQYVSELDEAEGIFDDIGVKEEYADQISDHAANLPDNAFMPTLPVLDGVMLSLRLDGSGTLPPPVTDRFAKQPDIPPDTLVSEFLFMDYLGDEYSAGTFYNGDVSVGNLAFLSQKYIVHNFYPAGPFELFALLEEKPATLDTAPNPLVIDPREVMGEVDYIETDVLQGVRLVVQELSASAEAPAYQYLFRGVTDEGHILLLDYDLERTGETWQPTLETLDTMVKGITFVVPSR